jgi:hypothetical protein
MGWESESAAEALDCGAPGDTDESGWVELKSKEFCQGMFVRDDGGGNDRWYLDVVRSSNASRQAHNVRRFMLEADELICEFVEEATFSFKIRIGNAETAKTDTIAGDFFYRKDGTNL